MHAANTTTHPLLAASFVAAAIVFAREVPAQSLPRFPHAVPPTDAASLVDFQVDGGPHTIAILPRGTESDVGSHAVDCAADCRLRLAPGRYVLLVARTPEGPRYARGFRVRTDTMLVHATSPHAMTPADLLVGTGVVAGVAGLALLIGYATALPIQIDGPPPAIPPPMPDARIAHAGLAMLGTGIAVGLVGMAVGLALRPRVEVLGGAGAARLHFGASPLAEGGFVGTVGWRM